MINQKSAHFGVSLHWGVLQPCSHAFSSWLCSA